MADDIGPYHIDGVVPDDTDPDLVPISDPAGNAQELGPLNNATTKIGVIHKDAVPTLGTTNPNAQVDLNTAWLDTTRVAGANNTFTDFLYFAWARDKDTGSGFIAYEFMKNAAPVACAYDTATQTQLINNCNPWANRDGDSDGNGSDTGDFLILWDQQGGSTELLVRRWIGTAPNLTLGPASALSNYDAEYSADGFRGEAAINLTANNLGSGGACNAFANVIPSTVTGNSDTADYKDTILKKIPLSNCESTTVTVPADSSGVAIPDSDDTDTVPDVSIGTGGVVAVKDLATVSLVGGTATPDGDVDFFLCKVDAPNTCNTGGTSVGSTDLTGASYPVTVSSPTAWVTSAGRYCWRAEFSGDPANEIPGSSDSSATECFIVNPVTPTLTTNAGDDVLLGNAVTDTATLTNTAPKPTTNIIETAAPDPATRTKAAGTITFTLYNASCVAVAGSTSVVNVNGDSSASNVYSASFTPTSVGTYHWGAVYSGDQPNTNSKSHNDDCTVGAETVVVETVQPTATTAQRWFPNDRMTISVAANTGNLAGTAKFEFFKNATCQGTPDYSQDVAVAGASPQTVGTTNTTVYVDAAGPATYSWQVRYTSTGNSAHRNIAPSCHETSTLTITNGGTIPTPPTP